ncbi:MAG: outer membrane protein assembly factor BamE [Chlorobium sp.]|nr:MAG: outer membrane protein assembly factor BamE [Chlorobium sp.]
MKAFVVTGLMALTLAGCNMTAANHADQLPSSRDRALTVGIVQKDIRKGMTQAEVAQSLGSPNIVSKDTDEVETWIYDKIASEASYSAGSGGILSLFTGGREAGAAATTQKTLTVIIKFLKGHVSDYSYHSSQF